LLSINQSIISIVQRGFGEHSTIDGTRKSWAASRCDGEDIQSAFDF
jgi:hypothetical protein